LFGQLGCKDTREKQVRLLNPQQQFKRDIFHLVRLARVFSYLITKRHCLSQEKHPP
jgi:hypothetical protein